MISTNSTLVIYGLQYTDSKDQFSSYVNVNSIFDGIDFTNSYEWKPVVSITVNGMSIFNCSILPAIASEVFIIYYYVIPTYCKFQVVCSY